MRRAFGEMLMSAGAVAVLLAALILFDDRVREQISLRVSSHPTAELAAAGEQVKGLTEIVLDAARDQTIGHAPLVIFTLAATILVIFMLRT